MIKTENLKNKISKFNIILILLFLFAPTVTMAATFNINKAPNNLGLVGYWTFDGKDITDKVYDRSGQNNNGYFIGSATSSAKVVGKIGQALNFKRNTNYVLVPNSPSLVMTQNLTISLWIKPRVLGDQSSHYVDYFVEKGYYDHDNYSFYNSGSDGKMAFEFEDSLGSYRSVKESTGSLRTNVWQQISVVFDDINNKIYFYKDGSKVYEANMTYSLADKPYDLFIGRQNATAAYYYEFNGLMDDVRIYNRALTAKEMQALYKSGASKFNASSADLDNGSTLESGLVGHWTFDGKNTNWGTNKVYDSSVNSNTGTMFGMSTSSSPTTGKIGQALKFDGVDDYVDVPGTPALASNLTITLWAKPNSTTMMYT